jgi:hypothetical protein
MRYIFKLSLFALLVFIPFAFPVFVLVSSGEVYSIPQVIRAQNQTSVPVLFRSAYSAYDREYKREALRARNPGIIVIGDSRAMKFRSAFFKEGANFYNAAGILRNSSNFDEILDAIPDDGKPRVIITDVGAYFFNPYLYDSENFEMEQSENSKNMARLFLVSLISDQNWRKIYRDYYQGKFTLRDIATSSPAVRIGLFARTGQEGFLNDGSFYEYETKEKTQRSIKATFDAISPAYGYEYGAYIDPRGLADWSNFLEKCKKRNIYVVAYLPPLAQSVYAKMLSEPNAAYAESIRTLGPRLSGLFHSYGFDFFDFADSRSFGGTDAEMIDANHGSEKAYARMVLKMAETNPVIAAAADTRRIKSHLDSSHGDFYIFNLDEF